MTKIHRLSNDKKRYTHIIAKERKPILKVNSSMPSGLAEEKTYDITNVAPVSTGTRAIGTSTRFIMSIGLPLPDNIEYPYSLNWGQNEMTAFGGLIHQASQRLMGFGFDIKETLNRELEQFGGSGLNAALGMIKNMSETVHKSIQRNLGISYNPNKELLFEGVDFRQFTFTWKFQPVSPEDADRTLKMIYDLIYHAEPDTLSSAYSPYILPAEFEVQFVGTDLPPLQTLVITNITVNFTNAGQPKFFHDGKPAFIGLSVSFMEIERLTKKNVFGEGYQPSPPIVEGP